MEKVLCFIVNFIIIAIKILIGVLIVLYWIFPDLLPGLPIDDIIVTILGVLGIIKIPGGKQLLKKINGSGD